MHWLDWASVTSATSAANEHLVDPLAKQAIAMRSNCDCSAPPATTIKQLAFSRAADPTAASASRMLSSRLRPSQPVLKPPAKPERTDVKFGVVEQFNSFVARRSQQLFLRHNPIESEACTKRVVHIFVQGPAVGSQLVYRYRNRLH